MSRKARILLISLIVTCATAISVAFHNCYVIDALHPELPPNVYPSINSLKVEPSLYHIVNIDLGTIYPEEGNNFLTFNIREVYDPDKEPVMYGKWAVDYSGTGPLVGGGGSEFRAERAVINGVESDTVWSCSFKIQIEVFFAQAKEYVVVAAISDRLWMTGETGNYFDVPEDTEAAVVMWVVKTTGSLPGSGLPD